MENTFEDLQQLATMDLIFLKGEKEEDDGWKFAGIASDEAIDIEGDTILKNAIDLSYAQDRGFVNWNHSRAPEDQLGFLTKATLIDIKEVNSLQKTFGMPLSKTASIYVEGELYKYVPKAKEVRNILKSAGATYRGGIGLSVDGVLAKSTDGKTKAMIRGVAMTPVPIQVKTLCALMKAIQSIQEKEELKVELKKGLSFEDAALFLLKKRPNWTYEFATKVVQYTMNQR